MAHKLALLLFLCSMSLATRAADVFKWVDENGKVHYGESVPERYQEKAKKVDPTGVEVDAERRREAEARRAREKAKAETLQRAREAQADVAPSASPTSQDVPQAGSDCQEQLRKYLESADCFGPFRLANGGIKPEAFQKCKEVKQPKGCFQKAGPADRTYLPPAP